MDGTRVTWQPIATAPDRQDVLVYWRRFNQQRVIRRNGHEWLDEDRSVYAIPDMWMPLADPPKDAA